MPKSSANILERVRNFLNPNRANPLFGKDVADRIKRTGSTYMEPYFGETKPTSMLNRLGLELMNSKKS